MPSRIRTAARRRLPRGLETAPTGFAAAFPEFDTGALEALRGREYARLDAGGHVYLDYTGASLYAESQVRGHQEVLAHGVFGNPHSANPTAQAATALAERARAAVLAFFDASPDEYAVVFTPNATGALRLVGEAYPFAPGGRLLLTADNHNSVNGIRELARRGGAEVTYTPLLVPELRLDGTALGAELDRPGAGGRRLFAFPAQSNFSGVRHSLEWIARAKAKGWDVLLDAAAFVPTNRLSLRRSKPDYVALSFYKLLGYPTGIGCLIARHAALEALRRPWFSGGTITVVSVAGDGHYLADGEAAFEDGTIDFLGLPALEIGLRHVTAVGLDTVHERVHCLTSWLLDRLTELRHPGGRPLVRVYGPRSMEERGGTVAFNVLAPDGSVVDYELVEAEANRRGISLRTGCFCNPGAREAALGLTAAELAPLFGRAEKLTVARQRVLLPGRATGAVRVSVGIASSPRDVAELVRFLEGLAGTRDAGRSFRPPARRRLALAPGRRSTAAARGRLLLLRSGSRRRRPGA